MPDSISTVVIVALCGAGTFLLRLLPMLRSTRKPANENFARFTEAVGPAAITALLTVMIAPSSFFESAASLQSCIKGIVVVTSLLATAAAHRRFGGIVIPTLCGTACYGSLMTMV